MNSLARLEIRTKWQEMQNKQDQLKDIGKDSESETETDFLDAREVYRIDPISHKQALAGSRESRDPGI